MSINDHILAIFRVEIPETYWYKSPTPGTGTYLVLDIINENTSTSKDIATMPTPGSKMRLQAKVYSDDTTDARLAIDSVQLLIRTTVNEAATGVIWLHASDESGTQAGYDPRADRFYYVVDFFLWYKTFAV